MNPPEDNARPDDKVPDPELSPTTNPVLAQNLGLWAQVYYTTPPEQRDQAVQKLLEELTGESGREGPAGLDGTATGPVAPGTVKSIPAPEPKVAEPLQPPNGAASEQAEPRNLIVPAAQTTLQEQAPEVLDDSLVCPACLHKNRLQQRFCGLCGFPLKSSQSTSTERAPVKKSLAVPPPPPAETFPRPREIQRSEESWDWLREKNATPFDTSSEHSGTWKYIALVAGVLVLILLGSIWWAGSKSSAPPAETPAAGKPAPAAPSEPSSSSRSSSAKSQLPSAREKANAATGPAPDNPPADKAHSPAEESPARAATPAANPSQAGSSDDDGTAELTQARRYLEGQGVPRDSRAASFWLWKAVAKKNTPAVLLLSDLYAHGDGVSRSCDQARVLLSAASQRGSTEAAAKLVSLRQTVCP